jgi:hypothetical protein
LRSGRSLRVGCQIYFGFAPTSSDFISASSRNYTFVVAVRVIHTSSQHGQDGHTSSAHNRFVRSIPRACIEGIELHFPRIAPPLRNKNQWTSTIGDVGAGKTSTMPGLYKAAAIVMSGGALVGFGVLMMLPPPPEDPHLSSSLFAAAQIANFFPEPCKQQLWLNTLNTDRVCQTWNLSDREAERLLAVPEPPAKASRRPSKSAADSHVAKGEMVVKARARVPRTADSQARPTRESGPRRMSTRTPTPAASPTFENTHRTGFPG